MISGMKKKRKKYEEAWINLSPVEKEGSGISMANGIHKKFQFRSKYAGLIDHVLKMRFDD